MRKAATPKDHGLAGEEGFELIKAHFSRYNPVKPPIRQPLVMQRNLPLFVFLHTSTYNPAKSPKGKTKGKKQGKTAPPFSRSDWQRILADLCIFSALLSILREQIQIVITFCTKTGKKSRFGPELLAIIRIMPILWRFLPIFENNLYYFSFL